MVILYRFDFVSIPIVHPRYERDSASSAARLSTPLTRSDKVIKVSEWTTLIVAKPSPWIDLESEDDVVRRNSEKVSCSRILAGIAVIHLWMKAGLGVVCILGATDAVGVEHIATTSFEHTQNYRVVCSPQQFKHAWNVCHTVIQCDVHLIYYFKCIVCIYFRQ